MVGIIDRGDTVTVTTGQIILRDYIISRLLMERGSRINGKWTIGSCADRLPNNINVSFDGVSGAALAAALGAEGVCVSTGSACNSGNGAEPSYVLKAMGYDDDEASAAIRITISERTTAKDAIYIADKVLQIVREIRRQTGYDAY